MSKNKILDTDLFDKYINDSGYKVGYIVEKLGISREAFNRKRKGLTPFRTSEVFVLCTMLNITDEEDKKKIFYPIC